MKYVYHFKSKAAGNLMPLLLPEDKFQKLPGKVFSSGKLLSRGWGQEGEGQ
jgi:hypothetical protein